MSERYVGQPLGERLEELEENFFALKKIQEIHNDEINELEKKLKDAHRRDISIRDDILEPMKVRIEKLEDSLQKCGVKWEFILDEHRGEINELKKSYRNNQTLRDKSFQHIYKIFKKLDKDKDGETSGIPGGKSSSSEMAVKSLARTDSTPSEPIFYEEEIWPEKEECEHNRPFWECEICGNIKYKKEPTDIAGSARQTELSEPFDLRRFIEFALENAKVELPNKEQINEFQLVEKGDLEKYRDEFATIGHPLWKEIEEKYLEDADAK